MSRYSFLEFNLAREYVRSLGIPSVGKWVEYYKSGLRPSYIPSNPNLVYKNKGWISYMDWLGTKNIQGQLREYIVNDNYFKKWSHNMAYILGFWWSDGYLDEKLNIFTLTQNKKDEYLLEQILKEMSSNYSLRTYRNKAGYYYVRTDIRSPSIVSDIVRMGGKQNKSLTIGFPNVPKKYMPDFIRGLWDGDGYVGWIWGDSGHRYRKISSSITSGSKKFIVALHKTLKDSIPELRGKIKIDKRAKGSVRSNNTICKRDYISYNLCFYQNDTRRLRDFVYQNDGILMQRKKKIFYDAGLINITKREFWDYDNAKKYAHGLSLASRQEWKKHIKNNELPYYIPRDPHSSYQNKGWIGWQDWLGYEKERTRGKNIINENPRLLVF